jgi:hypothetical protein
MHFAPAKLCQVVSQAAVKKQALWSGIEEALCPEVSASSCAVQCHVYKVIYVPLTYYVHDVRLPATSCCVVSQAAEKNEALESGIEEALRASCCAVAETCCAVLWRFLCTLLCHRLQ